MQPVPSIVNILRAAADQTRLRMLLLLQAEELSVAELQDVLSMGQSTISTHLSQLKRAGLVEDRRIGKNSLYRLTASHAGAGSSGSDPGSVLAAMLHQAGHEVIEAADDQACMRRVLKKREDRMRSFFDSMAGRLGKDYVPGKSWKSLAEALLRLMPPLVIADLGAGDGSFSLLLAQRAQRVIAVDSSEKMLEVARDQAARCGTKNVEFRLGDMEQLPIDDAAVDLAFFSQSLHHARHPGSALREAARILKPGGRVAILDLAKHRYEEARDLYADEWLGFSEVELESLLEQAGFHAIDVAAVDRSAEAPQFQTLLAIAERSL